LRFPEERDGREDRMNKSAELASVTSTERPRANFAESRISVEKQLLGIWERLFNVGPIHTRQNFFELGGDTLLAAGMICKVEEITGKRLSVYSVLNAPTIEQLANVIYNEATDQSRRSYAA
jgi:hypothetical protein